MRYSQFQRQNSSILLLAINNIIQNKNISINLSQLSTKLSNQVKVISLVNSFEPPLSSDKVQLIQNEINRLCQGEHDPKYIKIMKIKFYCKILQLCCFQQNFNFEIKYLNLLLQLIDTKDAIQQALYFIFGVKSIQKLKDYELISNLQFKYDTVTQVLFYYIISIFQPHLRVEMEEKFMKNYNSMQKNQKAGQMLTVISHKIKHTIKHTFLSQLIIKLAQKQYLVIYMARKKDFGNNCQRLQNLMNEYKYQNNNIGSISQTFEQIRLENRYHLILKQLQRTTLIKKMLAEMSVQIKPRIDPIQRMKLYKEYLHTQGQGNLYEFQKCRQGMNLLKYNFGNDQISWRFVKIDNEGIFWGKDSQNYKLKASWESITNLYYGKVTINILKKCKYIESNTIFSLGLQQRTIDFICQSAKEATMWIQGVTYILNKKWQIDRQKKIIYTPGKLLWKKLFMKLNLKPSVDAVTFKAKAIGATQQVVKISLSERRKI